MSRLQKLVQHLAGYVKVFRINVESDLTQSFTDLWCCQHYYMHMKRAFRTFVRCALVWFCLSPLPHGVWEVLRFVIVALPGLFSHLFWTVYQRHAKRLNHFHTSCLRKLLKIKWKDRIPDTEVLKRAEIQSETTEIGTSKMARPCYQNA